ncbi:14899_t:CDS:1, partial [Acaulospora morrowiae]
GAPKKVNKNEFQQLVKIVKDNRQSIAEEIINKFVTLIKKQISVRSVCHYLKELGYKELQV